MIRLPVALGFAFVLGLSVVRPASAQDAIVQDTSPQVAGATAAEPAWRTGMALIGGPALAPDFKHLRYVNPDAPKGGLARFSANGTFDTLNPILPKGTPAAGIGFMYDTLMTSVLDEASASYGLVAEALRYPDDFSWVSFRLRPEARFQDGTPITAEDVVWSFEQMIAQNPNQKYYYRHVTKAEVTGDREVTFTFDQAGNRELPSIVGQLMVLPKHWWEGTDAKGRQRSIGASTLDAPVGSGAYRIKTVVPGRTIAYERVPDYWGAGLPINVGTNNFDELRWEYFRDDTAELEAFKADQYDWRVEPTARVWATSYDFPAVKDGRVKLEMFPEKGSGVMVGFIPNLRREKFQDPRVRQALNLALDFGEMNRVLFYDQYQRVDSFFYGTELASSGVPTGAELALLESVRDALPEAERDRDMPPALFTSPYANPTAADTGSVRDNLRKAVDLLKAAGYELKGRRLVGPDGKPFTIEFLLNGPNFEKVGLLYQQSLVRIGITLTLRTVDTSQYVNRVRSRDFDMIYTGWAQSLSPGNEQRFFFGTEAADQEASQNYGGIKNPAVEALIDKVIYAKDRHELVTATRALDRVLLWNSYVVPGWTLPASRVARWDRFGHRDPLPEYSDGFPAVWWYDAEKAEKIGRAPQ